MMEACSNFNFSFTKEDAVKYLKSLPNESQVVVSGFHIVEHLPFEKLQLLVSEALRVLKPCGLLLMETPNPENILVGIKNFYIDPTHNKPIPPELLYFVAEYAGFYRIKTVRLQEDKDSLDNPNITVTSVLAGVSRDYAIIAQKEGKQEDLAKFDNAFSREYGISLEALGKVYDQHVREIQKKFDSADVRIEEFVAEFTPLKALLEHQGRQLEELKQILTENKEAHSIQQQHTQETQKQLDAIRNRLEELNQELTESKKFNIQQNNELQEQLEAARKKIDELTVLSHHWWTGADSLNHELQAVYKVNPGESPFRYERIMQAFKRFQPLLKKF